jgi:membrane protein DedA with SNARE-associated domain
VTEIGSGHGEGQRVHIDEWLQAIPPIAVYLIVTLVIGLESLGIPLPGEIVLVSASLLASRPHIAVQWEWVAATATAGAVIGDSIGYAIGRRYGKPLFSWLGAKFPKHFGPEHVAFAERVFARHGVWTVFLGRFIAVLRIFAGPLAGSLRMPYYKFLAANFTGGLTWATGTAFAVYALGLVAETWLSRFSWIGLVLAVVIGLTIAFTVKRKTNQRIERWARETAD